MSGEATTQVLDTSVDRDGLSIISTTKPIDNPRLGSMYNPTTLAAALPVWFHPQPDGQYLAVLKEHWRAATIGSGGPQSYSTHTTVTTPHWATVNPTTGTVTGLAEITSNLSGDRTLIAACSRTGYLFTVGTVDDVAYIAHHRIDDRGNLVLQAEEVLPVTLLDELEVSWFNGVYIDGTYLVVIGTDDSAGGLYRRRKPWGQVGTGIGVWEYKGSRGWFSDPAEVESETATGGVLTSASAVTHVKFRGRELLCTNDGTTARLWSSRPVDPYWKQLAIEIEGHAVYLQPQLYYNPASLAEGDTAAVPYVATERDETSGALSLKVSWGLIAV